MSDLFAEGGAAAAAMRKTDWERTSLGAPSTWPKALQVYVRTMLRTRQPITLFWGADLVNIYNDAMLPILGEKHPAAMGQRASECWKDAWPVIGAQLESVLEGTSVIHEELLVPIMRHGVLGDAWWNYSYSPAFDDDGRIVGVLVICTEVTREVATRRELESANRAKDEFLATVSHELRTPLTAILGWSRIIASGLEKERVQHGLEVIERNASAQAKLIDDILDVARIISGKLDLSPSTVRPARVIEAAVDALKPTALAKGVELVARIDGEREMTVDEGRFQQIVSNLLANGVKFTPKGGTVTLETREVDGKLEIAVSDTGRGISPSFLPFVFDRFRQEQASTTKQYAGLGLGLAIVRHLVELHGGTVRAESDGEGKGARFVVTMPCTPTDGVAEAISQRGATDASSGALDGARILVIDDQDDGRELMAFVLEEAGARVLEAESARAALDLLEVADIDVIVSDIGMPDLDGYSFMKRVREMPHTAQTPALAVTAFARLEDRERAVESGFSAHVAKPIDPHRLVSAVVAIRSNGASKLSEAP